MVNKFFSLIKSLLLRHKKYIFVIFVGIIISLLGYYLRLQMFFAFPPIGDTRDEVKNVFNGISLIKRGVPESWSWWDDYGEFPVQNIRGSDYRLVKPWFEEPPLFGFLSGAYAISKGMDSYEKVDAGAMRWPMLKLGALNVFLLFILIYLVAGLKEALLAGLIYATMPTIVLSSRLPLAENFLITLSLTSLLLLTLYLKKNINIVLVFCALISGLAVLVKQSGIFIPASIIFILFAQKRTKQSFFVAVTTLFFLGLWYAYGYYYNWPLFLHMQSIFSGREILLPTMIVNLFDTFRIAEKTMTADGWLIWGWISVVVFGLLPPVKKDGLAKLIPLTSIGSYLVFFAVMSGHAKGWYRFPFHPFLAWVIAVGFLKAVKNPGFLYSFFFITLAGFASFISGTGEHYWIASQVRQYQLFVPLIMAPFLMNELRKNLFWKRLCQIILIGVFVAAIWLNYRAIIFFQDQFWY